MYTFIPVWLSLMHYYTIHPITVKLRKVVDYTPAMVSGIVHLYYDRLGFTYDRSKRA